MAFCGAPGAAVTLEELYAMGCKKFIICGVWHSGLVENYPSNMFILPEEGIAVVVLVNMNDYLVGNNLLSNVMMPLIGEKSKIRLIGMLLDMPPLMPFICCYASSVYILQSR